MVDAAGGVKGWMLVWRLVGFGVAASGELRIGYVEGWGEDERLVRCRVRVRGTRSGMEMKRRMLW